MKQLSFLLSWITVGLMLVCLLSGIVLLFVYYPSQPYESIANFKFIPYAVFFRKLHYFSGELFLIFTLFHIVVELVRKSNKNISKFAYLSGVVAFIAVLVLMFSGYVLKGDLNAESAAQVAFALILNTPILENFISLFKDFNQFFWRFFILHTIIFPIILIYFLKAHSKRVFTKYFIVGLGLTLVVLSFISMPPDLNPLIMDENVSGPWFFLGGENLLIKGVNSIIVVCFLATPFVLLSVICFIKNRVFYNLILLLIVLWTVLYAYFYTI
ncbi:MAG: DUF4405 domain-containing protein [Campylobacteraceae bacterium]|nr:DUF4405 domain-containing protein [Campylobacteraceae bacterium]